MWKRHCAYCKDASDKWMHWIFNSLRFLKISDPKRYLTMDLYKA
jgi:hypothetical protein